MIKSTYKILVLLFSVLVIISACKKEDNILEYTGEEFFRFAAVSGEISEDATDSVDIEVFYSTTTGSSGTVSFTLGGDLVEGTDYIVANSSNSLSFNEANGYKDVITIAPVDNNDVSVDARVLTITLSSPSGGSVGFPGPDALNSSYDLTLIEDDCPSSLAGTYEVSTSYAFHDFLPDFSTHTMIVEITEVTPGVYSTDDFSGGLYSVGPYVAAYGTTGILAQFSDVCNELSWTDQSDPWGPMVALTGGVNSVDPSTGVITISWSCEAYGENGVSIYTPQ